MSSTAKSVNIVPGKLKFKSNGPAKTSSNNIIPSAPVVVEKKRKLEEESSSTTVTTEVHLTEAQKRFKQRQIEKEKMDAKKLAGTSFRDRIENFNQKLSKLTEHNDIPRVSAAGNG
jgi:protein FAM32A